MKYPVRNSQGILTLQTGHFGIKDPVLLYALPDLVKGYTTKAIAERVGYKSKVKVSEFVIRDNFRKGLYNALRKFAGDETHESFENYCKKKGLPMKITGNAQLSFCMARYLLDVFDLNDPVEVWIYAKADT